MLGRTHTSIGLAVVSLVAPGLMQPVFSATKMLLFVTSVVATIIGSLAPDLDHPNSKGSRKVFFTEIIGKAMTLLIGLGILYSTYALNLPELFYWLGGLLTFSSVMVFSLAKRILPMVKIERIGMIIVGMGLLILNYQYHFHPIVNLFGIAYLVFGILKHRGLTHSPLGWAIFASGWFLVVQAFPYFDVTIPIINKSIVIPMAHTLVPFILGYGLHLAADFIADGGLPLLFPWEQRFKSPITITTGKMLDTLIGLGAFAVFAWSLYQRFI
jgi:inner membrane protein